jgi:hypothetical protein
VNLNPDIHDIKGQVRVKMLGPGTQPNLQQVKRFRSFLPEKSSARGKSKMRQKQVISSIAKAINRKIAVKNVEVNVGRVNFGAQSGSNKHSGANTSVSFADAIQLQKRKTKFYGGPQSFSLSPNCKFGASRREGKTPSRVSINKRAKSEETTSKVRLREDSDDSKDNSINQIDMTRKYTEIVN